MALAGPGRDHDLPVEAVATDRAAEHFGWLGAFLGMDMAASGARARERFGWSPVEVGLLADLEAGHYFGRPAGTVAGRAAAGIGDRGMPAATARLVET